MTTQKETADQKAITKTGNATYALGSFLTVACAALGIVAALNGGNWLLLLGVPVGILLMLLGRFQKTAAIAQATYEAGLDK